MNNGTRTARYRMLHPFFPRATLSIHLPQRLNASRNKPVLSVTPRSRIHSDDFHVFCQKEYQTPNELNVVAVVRSQKINSSVSFARPPFVHGVCHDTAYEANGRKSEHENALEMKAEASNEHGTQAMTLINIGCVHEWMFAMWCQSQPKSSLKRFILVASVCVSAGWPDIMIIRSLLSRSIVFNTFFTSGLDSPKDRNICSCFLPKFPLFLLYVFKRIETHTHKVLHILLFEFKCFGKFTAGFCYCLLFWFLPLSELSIFSSL